MRRRKANHSLARTRIRVLNQRYYYEAPEPLVNPDSGKQLKVHPLCSLKDGEDKARELRARIIAHNYVGKTLGNMPHYLEKYIAERLKKRKKKAPKEEARLLMFERRNDELRRQAKVVAESFANGDVAAVRPTHLKRWLKNWEGQRMAEVYRSFLVKFFAWCKDDEDLRTDNPAAGIQFDEQAPDRKVRISPAEFWAAHAALAVGKDGRPTQSGPMMQCLIELYYMLIQRGTEIRLLRRDQIIEQNNQIFFKPTKTEHTSGGDVLVPLHSDIKAVFDRAKRIGRVANTTYLFCSRKGKPYTSGGMNSAWTRACKRIGLKDRTLKDLRAMAMMDAKDQGYSIPQLQIAAVHSDKETTEGYLKQHTVPVSEVILRLPAKKQITLPVS